MNFLAQSFRFVAVLLAFVGATNLQAQTTLQLLHASDFEASTSAVFDAPNFAAIVDSLEGTYANTLILSSGDNILPSPFLNAGEDASMVQPYKDAYYGYYGATFTNDLRAAIGRADISIMNFIGIEASALGNHEFDLGTSELRNMIGGVNSITSIRWMGAQFPYLSSNLNFSGDANLSPLFEPTIKPNSFFKSVPTQSAADIAATRKLASSTIIVKNGVTYGIVGATTPILASISSPGATTVKNPGANTNNMALLATIIQPVVDSLVAQGIDKIILLAHMQQLNLEKELATLLKNVDIIVAGGSHTLMADSTDRLRAGDQAAETYPYFTNDADGNNVAIVNTTSEYKYVGRLVIDFDEMGEIVPSSVDPAISGAYAADTIGVSELYANYQDAFAAGKKGALVRTLTNAISNVIASKDGNLFGKTDVYLEGRREFTRTEETNLGNLSADANLWAAQAVDPTVMISIKNGGGIRSSMGYIEAIGTESVNAYPPAANPLAGKPAGSISQLDIENALRFNNRLSLLTLTATNLRAILEHSVAATAAGQTPGRFPQIGGLKFSYNPTLAAGSRVRNAVVVDANGLTVDSLIINGAVYGNPSRTFRIVTLNFLASGGDSYPFNTLGTNRKDLDTLITTPGTATFTVPGSEQDAFAEYMQAFYNVTPYAIADKTINLDERIQEVTKRLDAIIPGIEIPGNGIDDDFDGIVDDACSLPTNYKEIQQSATSMYVSWDRSFNQGQYTIEYKRSTDPAFTTVTTPINGYLFTNLVPGASYVYRVRANCSNNTNSDFNGIENFFVSTSEICNRPISSVVRAVSTTSAQYYWNYEPGSTAYQIRYRKSGNPVVWTRINVSSAEATALISGLMANTDYLCQVRAFCGGAWTKFSPIVAFKTLQNGIQPLVMANDVATDWTVYPNPTSTFISIDAKESLNIVGGKIYSMNGALVFNATAEALKNGIDISDLANGTYTIQVLLADGTNASKRFVVMK